MNKISKIILIISVIVFGVGFLLINSAQAGVVRFGDKDIFVDFDELPFNLSNWAPGMSSSPKTIVIINNENFDINLYFKTKKTLGDDVLADVLTITIDDKLNHLSELFNDNIALTSVNSGEFQSYNIAISFDQDAGNECQGKSINFDFIITAEEIGKGGEEIPPVVIPGGGTYIPITPTTSTTDTGEVIATPGEGGITTLTNPDGSEIKLIIPSDTVSQNTNFTIDVTDVSSVNRPEPETGLFLIAGLVYEIKAEVNGEFITSFNKALTLSFTYTDEQIEGLDEASLKIYYWDDIQNQWITLENSEVNIDNNTVIASIDHFTLFALIGLKTVSPEEEKIGEEEETPRGETEEKIGEEEEEVILGGETEEGEKDREAPAEEEGVSIGGLQRGLASMMAAIGMTWGEISKSAFLTIIVILCLMGLVLIGIREWRLFQKKRKRWEE